jgi:hypothetical protein
MGILGCALVHHTGSMIRFRTSQLPELPSHDRNILIGLPNGRVVDGHFRRHPDNPNVSGAELVRYIKGVLPFGANKPMMIDATGTRWQLYEIDDAVPVVTAAKVSTRRLREGTLTGSDLAKLLKLADGETQTTKREIAYGRLLRPPGLRRLILSLMGTDCQVEGCSAVGGMRKQWGDAAAGVAIVQVHHIEAMAQRVDHHPNNLCVLCANHHALIHGYGPWDIGHAGHDVVLTLEARSLRVVRDLSFLTT